MSAQYGLYAYGLVGKSPEPLAILGIDQKHKLYPLEGREMCVMVSTIDIATFQHQVKTAFSELAKSSGAAQAGSEALLQAHEDVVATLMRGMTVVPFTFGTILKDEQAAAKMLEDEEEKFQTLLAKFTGRAEWGLKVYAEPQEVTQYIVQLDPKFKKLKEQQANLSRGAAYLFGRKMEEDVKATVVARLANVCEGIFQELKEDAYEAKVNKTLPQTLTRKKKEMILNTVYLVEKENDAHFCEHGKRLREKYEHLGLDLEVSGPWPPYSFT